MSTFQARHELDAPGLFFASRIAVRGDRKLEDDATAFREFNRRGRTPSPQALRRGGEGRKGVIRELRELALISNLNLFRALKPFQLPNFDPPTRKNLNLLHRVRGLR